MKKIFNFEVINFEVNKRYVFFSKYGFMEALLHEARSEEKRILISMLDLICG